VLAVAKRAPEQVGAVFLTFDGFLDGDDVGSAGSFRNAPSLYGFTTE
jgi:hypothetical protein